MPLFGQDHREQTGNYWVERGGNRISKGPRDRIQTWVSASAAALYVGALTIKLLAQTRFSFLILK